MCGVTATIGLANLQGMLLWLNNFLAFVAKPYPDGDQSSI
jgi:hypothetical protein